ncbi:MAG: FAD-dependent monooxygenase, partial [Brachymonas sp.]|nr:FAD-dependent monooxygenase [Brachymonas sp.]
MTDASASSSWLIAGAGIGGLAAACALAQRGEAVTVLEREPELKEFGAGIQLGPNAVRVLQSLGVMQAYEEVACFPEKLQVRDGMHTQLLGELNFRPDFLARYSAPYSTVHRADLQRILYEHAQQLGIAPQFNSRVTGYIAHGSGVDVAIETSHAGGLSSHTLSAQALIGADGLWSQVRKQLLPDEVAPRYSGILAYRALVPQHDLPQALRSQHITLWLAPHWHAVHYPVCAGEYLNVVILVEGPQPQDLTHWDHTANAADLNAALTTACPAVRDLVANIGHW